MDKLFGNLKQFIKPPSSIIDNKAYRLHYKFSVVILIACSLLVTSRQYFGDPIDCISRDDVQHDKGQLLDNYCWIHTTFSLAEAWQKKMGEEVPYPGVDKTTKDGTRVHHAYYQWVCFVLFFQAIFFYVPRYIWKSFEGGRVRNIMLGLDCCVVEEEKKNRNIGLLVQYLERNLHNHNLSFYVHTATEILNFVNVLLQLWLMDRFLHGQFTTYGFEVLAFTEWDQAVRFDPMIKRFPRLTKCTFHRFGPSGDVQKHDAMCILPINILNEKIYIFLWFWFALLLVVSLLAIVYRVATIVFPKVRVLVTRSRFTIGTKSHIEPLVNKLNVGDWFLLDLLGKNLDEAHFKDLVENYYATLQDSKNI